MVVYSLSAVKNSPVGNYILILVFLGVTPVLCLFRICLIFLVFALVILCCPHWPLMPLSFSHKFPYSPFYAHLLPVNSLLQSWFQLSPPQFLSPSHSFTHGWFLLFVSLYPNLHSSLWFTYLVFIYVLFLPCSCVLCIFLQELWILNYRNAAYAAFMSSGKDDPFHL